MSSRRDRKRRDTGSGQLVARVNTFQRAQSLLRAKDATSQAGFTAERIPKRMFARRPILIDDGDAHAAHRKELIRFLSPRTLEVRHRSFIEHTAAEYVAQAQQRGSCHVDELALLFSVRVASHIVGLTASDTPRLAHRLQQFFQQPPVDHTRADLGRSTADWQRAAKNALLPLANFYFRDVKPAIRQHRKHPVDDIIGFLLTRGYRPREILMECLTYGTAGMVTTREFMTMALLTLYDDAALCARYLAAAYDERLTILSEIIRLEPPVAHLYRRVHTPTAACPYAAGTLVDVDVRQANRDPDVFTPDPETLCPTRGLAASERTGLSFGDGAHRCPGSHLALMETDVLVRTLLQAGATLRQRPTRSFVSLVQGYQLRGLVVTFAGGTASPATA